MINPVYIYRLLRLSCCWSTVVVRRFKIFLAISGILLAIISFKTRRFPVYSEVGNFLFRTLLNKVLPKTRRSTSKNKTTDSSFTGETIPQTRSRSVRKHKVMSSPRSQSRDRSRSPSSFVDESQDHDVIPRDVRWAFRYTRSGQIYNVYQDKKVRGKRSVVL